MPVGAADESWYAEKRLRQSYANSYDVTTDKPEIMQFQSALVQNLIPMKAGTVNVTVTTKDPKLEQQFTDTKEVTLKYLNPLKELSVQEEKLTVKVGETIDAGLIFTGENDTKWPEKYPKGLHVTESYMTWEQSGEGQVLAYRSYPVIMQGDKDFSLEEGTVSNDQWLIKGVKEGTVVLKGTAKDTTNGEKTVTLTITVEAGDPSLNKPVEEQVADALAKTGAYQLNALNNAPAFLNEWSILGLARAGIEVPENFYETYYASAYEKVQEQKKVSSRPWDNKITETQRLALALTAKYADIVLPACTSVERGEVKAYQGGYLTYTKPVIPPLYESKSDVDILCELARVMDLDDEYLKGGYDACMEWIFDGCGVTLDELKASDLPVKVPVAKWPVLPGNCLKNGFKTPTGKFEFYATAIAKIDPKFGLDPLPSYYDSLADQNDPETAEKYPFYLCTGARLAHAIHSRTHDTPWLRSLRPYPTCEIHKADAARLGLKNGDTVAMSSPYGEIRMKVKVTSKAKPGVVMALHGYTEANVNELIGRNHLDPYSGYPGFKGMRCNIRKVEEA